jgi:hypothetical protein
MSEDKGAGETPEARIDRYINERLAQIFKSFQIAIAVAGVAVAILVFLGWQSFSQVREQVLQFGTSEMEKLLRDPSTRSGYATRARAELASIIATRINQCPGGETEDGTSSATVRPNCPPVSASDFNLLLSVFAEDRAFDDQQAHLIDALMQGALANTPQRQRFGEVAQTRAQTWLQSPDSLESNRALQRNIAVLLRRRFIELSPRALNQILGNDGLVSSLRHGALVQLLSMSREDGVRPRSTYAAVSSACGGDEARTPFCASLYGEIDRSDPGADIVQRWAAQARNWPANRAKASALLAFVMPGYDYVESIGFGEYLREWTPLRRTAAADLNRMVNTVDVSNQIADARPFYSANLQLTGGGQLFLATRTAGASMLMLMAQSATMSCDSGTLDLSWYGKIRLEGVQLAWVDAFATPLQANGVLTAYEKAPSAPTQRFSRSGESWNDANGVQLRGCERGALFNANLRRDSFGT